jgi:hypothetical protein
MRDKHQTRPIDHNGAAPDIVWDIEVKPARWRYECHQITASDAKLISHYEDVTGHPVIELDLSVSRSNEAKPGGNGAG